MSDPDALLRRHSDEISGLRDRSRRRLGAALDHAANDLQHTRARVVALSPSATLERGYAVIQTSDGTVVREPVEAGQELTVRVAGGRFEVTTIGGAR
jgi:exodeoxyribonuclease VII large subunit